MQRFLLVILVITTLSFKAQASPEREFVMSCTYGVLAGTLVGAASLAFVDKPGENLQRVARGASLGLYIGIGLGLYTVYILPKQIEKEEDKKLEDGTGQGSHNFFMFPLIADRGVDGVGAVWIAKRF